MRRCVSVDTHQLDVKNEGCIRGYNPGIAMRAIGELRWNPQLPLAAYFHSLHTLVPAFDDVATPQGEGEWLARIDGAIEFLPRGEPSGVVNSHLLAVYGRLSSSLLYIPIFETGRCLDRVPRNLSGGAGIGTRGGCGLFF